MFILDFSDIRHLASQAVGGKARALAELMEAGLPVPNGFVITAEAAATFLKSNSLSTPIRNLLRSAQDGDSEQVAAAAMGIRLLISRAAFPTGIASQVHQGIKRLGRSRFVVRSSGAQEDSSTRSMAGLFDSFLNVTARQVLSHVKRCWASYFSPRALSYYRTAGIDADLWSISVIVQTFIPGTASGVCFTQHPVSHADNAMVLEACYGLGPALVGGHVTPDRFLVSRTTGQVIDASVSRQSRMLVPTSSGLGFRAVHFARQMRPKVSASMLTRIVGLCSKIEKFYHAPQDVEWVTQNRSIFIVQARPITALGERAREAVGELKTANA